MAAPLFDRSLKPNSAQASRMTTANQVDLFLLGKTGQGKSSTGNTILGRHAFEVSDSSDSETFEVQFSWCRRLGRVIKVVDGPGLWETRLDRSTAAEKLTRDMCQGILQCPNGFHALLLVLRYGTRYTDEELQTVEILKSIFGESFVRDFCILIFTHGENFDMNNNDAEAPMMKTFSEWCWDQKGTMQNLLTECSYRAMLFYNKSPDKFDFQVQELLSLVDNLKSRGVRYTHDIFRQAATTREQLIVQENAPQLRESIQARVDLLVDGLQKLRTKKQLNDDVRKLVSQLKQDARDLETDIVVQDKRTGVLNSLKQVVANLIRNIETQEEALRERGDKARMKRALDEAQSKFEKDLNQLREERNSASRKGKLLSGVQAVASCLPFFGPIGAVLGIAGNVAAFGYNFFTEK